MVSSMTCYFKKEKSLILFDVKKGMQRTVDGCAICLRIGQHENSEVKWALIKSDEDLCGRKAGEYTEV